jgi:hypothetical protein
MPATRAPGLGGRCSRGILLLAAASSSRLPVMAGHHTRPTRSDPSARLPGAF